MSHIVEFYESERGWGGEIWYRRYDTLEEAIAAVRTNNVNLPTLAPDYYIVASYIGVDLVNNPKYDATYKH